jgi:hypothetical protein
LGKQRRQGGGAYKNYENATALVLAVRRNVSCVPACATPSRCRPAASAGGIIHLRGMVIAVHNEHGSKHTITPFAFAFGWPALHTAKHE